eukprot:433135-Heterocapsa_arctica.AAC.1
MVDLCGRHSQVGSLAGAAHLFNGNAGVLSSSSSRSGSSSSSSSTVKRRKRIAKPPRAPERP